jgi:hypothetical protein
VADQPFGLTDESKSDEREERKFDFRSAAEVGAE